MSAAMMPAACGTAPPPDGSSNVLERAFAPVFASDSFADSLPLALLPAGSERAGEPDARALPRVGRGRPRGTRGDLRAEPSGRQAVPGLSRRLVSHRDDRRCARPPRLDVPRAQPRGREARRKLSLVRSHSRLPKLAAGPVRRHHRHLTPVLLRGGRLGRGLAAAHALGVRAARSLARIDSRGGCHPPVAWRCAFWSGWSC